MQEILNRLQLRHYRLLQAIDQTGQLSLASARLGMTQPAASRLLAEAERVLEEALFERHPRGMIPTPVGEVLIRRAGNLLHGLEQTAREVADFRSGKVGTVRVGAVTGPAVRFLVPAIQGLKADSPSADISVDVAPSVELMPGLVNGYYDFVLCRIPPEVDARRLDIGRGRVEEVAFLVREGHELLAEGPVELDRLGGFAWVVQGAGMPIREALEQAFINRGVPVPEDIVNSASLLVTIAYLQHSQAIAAVSREVVDLLVTSGSGGLRTLSLGQSIILSPYHLIRWKERPISPLAQRLLDLVFKEMSR